jgi:hypothetical protein
VVVPLPGTVVLVVVVVVVVPPLDVLTVSMTHGRQVDVMSARTSTS